MRVRALVELRQLGLRHPLLTDLVVAVATMTVSLLLGVYSPTPAGDRDFDGLGFALTCLANLALMARQRSPVSVMVYYCAIWIAYISLDYSAVVNSPGFLLALYTVAALKPVRVTVVTAVLGCAVWIYAAPEAIVVATAQGVVWMSVVSRLGYGAQQLATRNTQLAHLAERLAIEQDERARRAVVDERLRIARELHDVVAHHMSVISVQAGLAQYVLDDDRDTARAALSTVMAASSEGLDEMRRLLSVLRPGSDSDASGTAATQSGSPVPAPGLDRLDDLAARVRTAGVPVELTVTGERQPLAPGLDTCVYRMIQEGLTNVLKHSAAANVTVALHFEAGRLTARITDDGTPLPEPRSPSGGQGINGMRERAMLYGGTLTAGQRIDGGFEVVLTVPV
ncbi:sensor histidine kinase [Micromonospora sonneratiae]|uniref:histidine kinase n=1 Tax=Micromonospora sonneratiae TaxID=1184706 RepID=A0ABW3YAP6_9ACTN